MTGILNKIILKLSYFFHACFLFVTFIFLLTVFANAGSIRQDNFLVKFASRDIKIPSDICEELLLEENKPFRLLKNWRSYSWNNPLYNYEYISKVIKNIPGVLHIEKDIEYIGSGVIKCSNLNNLPNDPLFSRQWALHNMGQLGGLVDADIDAPEVWQLNTDSDPVVVAVIDSGIDYTHEDLEGNMWRNQGELGIDENGAFKSTNGIDDDNNGYIDDIYGWDFVSDDSEPLDDVPHGTHIAGIIAALRNNYYGISGVADNVKLMSLKFLNANNVGTTTNVLRSIEYAIENLAQLINASWNGDLESLALREAIALAGQNNILFIAAAGNGSSNNDFVPTYPASFEENNIITVASTDMYDNLSFFSNYGSASVDIAAPGSSIYSTLPGNRYGAMSGTSMAAPVLTAAVAAILPLTTSNKILSRLLAASDKLYSLKDKSTGGRLNLYNSFMGISIEYPWPEDDSLWQRISNPISSLHPCDNDSQLEWRVHHLGAKHMRMHFSKIDMQYLFDNVTILNASGEEIENLSGKYENYFTLSVYGDEMTILLNTNNTTPSYGFDMDYYEVVY